MLQKSVKLDLPVGLVLVQTETEKTINRDWFGEMGFLDSSLNWLQNRRLRLWPSQVNDSVLH